MKQAYLHFGEKPKSYAPRFVSRRFPVAGHARGGAAYKEDGEPELEKKFNDLKTGLEKKAEELATKAAKDEVAKEIKSINEKMDKIKSLPENITGDMLIKAIKDVETITKDIEEVSLKLKAGGPGGQGPQLEVQIKENKDKLKAVAKKTSREEITIKAATTRASVATANVGGNIPGIGQLGRVKRSYYDVCTKIPVSNYNNDTGVIPYTDWDEDTTVKAAAAVAENTAFAESTAKFKGYTLPIQKIGDTLPVSEEFFEDEALAAGELRMFLTVNVDSAVDYELINGDNTGSHLKGLLASVPAWDTATAAGTVKDANIYDLVTKVITSITSTRGSKYSQFSAIMAKSTIDRLILKKDANDNYQFPPNHPIYDLIVEDNNMADNVMVVGDCRYSRIYEKVGVTLSQGTVDTQFTEDMMTLKVRTRLCHLIRTVDQTGYKKVTDVDAAVLALTKVAP